MNEITKEISWFFIESNLTTAFLLSLMYLMGAIFFIKSLQRNNLENHHFFNLDKYISDDEFKLTSRTIKKINFKRFFLVPIIGSLVIIFITTIFNWDYLITKDKTGEVQYRLLLWHFIFYGLIIFIDLGTIFYTIIYAFVKKFKFETNDQDLIWQFATFKNEWFQKYGKEKVELIFEVNNPLFNSKKNSLYSEKYTYKYSQEVEKQMLGIKKKHSNNTDLFYMAFFERYLTYTRYDFNSFMKNNIIIRDKKTGQQVNLLVLKEIIIHNFLCIQNEVQERIV